MGIISELHFDQDRCTYCGALLAEHIAGKCQKRILHEHDDELCVATMAYLRCGNCDKVNRLFYMADPIPVARDWRKRPFACTPTI